MIRERKYYNCIVAMNRRTDERGREREAGEGVEKIAAPDRREGGDIYIGDRNGDR